MRHSYFSNLSKREKYYLLSGAIILVTFIIYYFLWSPLSETNQHLFIQIRQQQELLQWMHSQQIEIKRYDTKKPRNQNQQPLFTTVENALEESRLNQLKIQLTSKNSDRLQVQIDQIEFDKLIGWLTKLQMKYDITTSQATFNRIDNNIGFVQASIMMGNMNDRP